MNTTHNGFPIVDIQNKLIGMILRSQLLVILENISLLIPA